MKERKFTISFVNIRRSEISRSLPKVGYDEQLRSMVHSSSFANNVADVIVDVVML